MGLRDRVMRPRTISALISWRLGAGAALAVAVGLLSGSWALALPLGVAAWLALSFTASDKPDPRPALDPFVLSEPWRQMIMSAQSAQRRLADTIAAADAGPIRERLLAIAKRLDHGLDEAWAIAASGDQIDAAIKRLEPTRLRSNLAVYRSRAEERGDDPASDPAIASIEQQLATISRLEARSARTAEQLRTTHVKLDEIVARANEVRLGSLTPDTYAADVDDLVLELESLHQAIEEVEGL